MARAVLHGIAVSSGIAIGKGFFLNRAPATARHIFVPCAHVEEEVERLETAIEAVAGEFVDARSRIPEELRIHADLLESHLQICRDPKLGGETVRRIREQRMNAEWALEASVDEIAEKFSRIDSPYIRDRIEDIRMVAARIMQQLCGGGTRSLNGEERGILLAYDLAPADAGGLSPKRIFSFAVEQGGKTSHTGILARSLRIPAVVGISGLSASVMDDDLIIVDGLKGRVLIAPDESELAEYAYLQASFDAYQTRIRTHTLRPAETEDGRRIAVLANVESSAEAEAALAAGSEGIGLVRTEFDYITRTTLPDEEALYEEYTALVKAFAPQRVTFRTLDVGSDKSFGGQRMPGEANPALGMRAIRYCMRHQNIFRTQLRALLRAGAHGNAALMFPLISGVSELRAARAVLNEAIQELGAADIPFAADMPIGIMVELPSAVLMADVLAREVDFFSIGTNDLIQYSLGVDRDNTQVAHMHQPLAPPIIRAIKQVVDMAHKAGISVSVCGEMAADPYCLPILIGMEVDELSLAPQVIPAIKHLIRGSNVRECRDILTLALSAPTTGVIANMVRQAVYNRFPDDVSFFVSQSDADI